MMKNVAYHWSRYRTNNAAAMRHSHACAQSFDHLKEYAPYALVDSLESSIARIDALLEKVSNPRRVNDLEFTRMFLVYDLEEVYEDGAGIFW